MSKTKKFSTFDEANNTWRSPVDIGADASNVDLSNGKNIQEVLGNYVDTKTVAELLVPMTGASSSIAGIGGLVPSPAAGDENKALLGNGTWSEVAAGRTISYADWLLLSPEEQAHGEYFVPDWNGSVVPVAGFDPVPTKDSMNMVNSGGIYNGIEPLQPKILSSAIPIGGTVQTTVEGALEALSHSDSSEVISYQQWLQLTEEQKENGDYYVYDYNGSVMPIGGIDTVPTQNSPNLVASGGVYSALALLQPKNLSAAISIGGVSQTTVEAALQALATLLANFQSVTVMDVSNISSLPITINSPDITSDMYAIEKVPSNGGAMVGDWNITTGNGTVTITGTISGTTDLTILFAKGKVATITSIT